MYIDLLRAWTSWGYRGGLGSTQALPSLVKLPRNVFDRPRMSVPFHVDLIGVATRDFWALCRTNDVPRLLAGILLSLQMKRVDQAQPYLHYLDNLIGGTAGIFQRLCAAFRHFVFLCFVLGRGAFRVRKKNGNGLCHCCTEGLGLDHQHLVISRKASGEHC